MPAARRRTTAASPITAETDRSAATGLLIYDGDCGFCTSAARRFAVFAKDSGASIAPWQGVDLEAIGLTQDQASSAVQWVRGQTILRGADAVAAALRVCGQPWSGLGRILATPPFIWLARALYPLIARFRHRLPGATNACRI